MSQYPILYTAVNKTAICVLTRYYSQYWVDVLNTFTNYDCYLVIDDNTNIYDESTQTGNVRIIQVPDEVCYQSNYYKSSTWSNLKDIVAWDRALYYFNRVNTDYENIWFTEDDVFFHSHTIFKTIDDKYPSSDLLCAFHEINPTGDIHAGWNHWINVIHRIGTPWAHSLIAVSRLSRRLLQRVDDYLSDRHLMFIEALFNTLCLHHNYVVDNPTEMTTTIHYDTKWDIDNIDFTKLYHPIKKIEDHIYIRNKIKNSIIENDNEENIGTEHS
jgi:hypothetical protein